MTYLKRNNWINVLKRIRLRYFRRERERQIQFFFFVFPSALSEEMRNLSSLARIQLLSGSKASKGRTPPKKKITRNNKNTISRSIALLR